MQHAVEEIGAMTESLEASGFERRQADATVRAIASSIEKFAVTPEVLRKAFDGHRSEMADLIKEQTEAMNARFDQQTAFINARFEDQTEIIKEPLIKSRSFSASLLEDRNDPARRSAVSAGGAELGPQAP